MLDPFHPYGRTKRLRGKPVNDFGGSDLFLRILAAEREQLITVTMTVRHPLGKKPTTEALLQMGMLRGCRQSPASGSSERS